MANIQIVVVNATSNDSVLTDAEAQAVVPALQQQVASDFAPVWGVNADLSFCGRNDKRPAGVWWLSLLDSSDQANAGGYHDLTPDGLPLGKVFVLTERQVGSRWTVAASHELLEMLGDPDINLWAFPQPEAQSGRLYAYEVCDPCEDDKFGYEINGVMVSDFVYPSWFESFWAAGSTQFDRQRQINQPFQILQGGYALVYDIQSGTGYQQIFDTPGTTVFSPNQRPRVGSRRERRMTARPYWRSSRPCGIERWPVKTLADDDAAQVNLTPQQTTVAALCQLARPDGLPDDQSGPQSSRYPDELQTYTLTASLKGAKIEADNDVHLVIADPNDSATTMIAEFPLQGCVQCANQALVSQMADARSKVMTLLPSALQRVAAGAPITADLVDPATSRLRLHDVQGTAQITGVLFFDRIHDQDGVAPNGVELHPVLDFTVVPSP